MYYEKVVVVVVTAAAAAVGGGSSSSIYLWDHQFFIAFVIVNLQNNHFNG
jgi:hypothetical protein